LKRGNVFQKDIGFGGFDGIEQCFIAWAETRKTRLMLKHKQRYHFSVAVVEV
jgi:hypothetical protein